MSVSAFPIVGIGASAGGLEAFHKFFDHMPADCGMAFVMILHLPADRKSMLARSIQCRWIIRIGWTPPTALAKIGYMVPPREPLTIVKLYD